MKNPKPNTEKDLKQTLMLIAYKGIFSNPEMYQIAIDHYRQSDARSVPQAIARICSASADAFISELNKEST